MDNAPTESISDRVARAKAYPFLIPASSYLFKNGEFTELPRNYRWGKNERVGVLAIGSNRSPEQLRDKYLGAHWGEIPVVKARLDGFDVVYSAYITRRGYIPATLHVSPNTRVDVSITWLTPDQLAEMHTTEASGVIYDYCYAK